MTKNYRIHRAWFVCAGTTLLLFTSVGIICNAFTIFQPYIIQRGHLTEGQGSLLITTRVASTLLSTMVCVRYYRIVGLRKGMVLALLPGTLSMILYAVSTGFSGCCTAAALAGVTCGLCCIIPATILVERWFSNCRGLALGICSSGTGGAAVVGPPLIQALISRFGTSFALLCIAIFFVVSGIVSYMLIRDNPSEMNLSPYGSKQVLEKKNVPILEKSQTKPMFLLLPAAFFLAASGGPALGHMGVYLSSEGYPAELAAWMVSSIGLTMTFGKCILGRTADRLGNRRACLIFGSALVIGQIMECLIPLHFLEVSVIGLLISGLGMSMCTVGIPILTRTLCGSNKEALGRTQSAHIAGSLCLSPLPGIIADYFGSYQPAYILFAGMTLAAVVLILAAFWIYTDQKQF